MSRGSSHELAALLLTEVSRFTVISLRKPLYCVYLDKMSAFDMVLKTRVVPAALEAAGGPEHADQSLAYIGNRLSCRRTYLEHNKSLMGPIFDGRGTEQGGILSSEEYQLANNIELDVANNCGLGVTIGPVHIGSVGAADDTVLVSDSLVKLQSLLNLSLNFCDETFMKLVQDKSHLVVLSPKNAEIDSSGLSMDNFHVPPTSSAVHLGLLRANSLSNMPAIQDKIAKHQKALFPVLSCGGARGHRGNPAASLKVEQLYAAPILFNCLGSLVLNRTEMRAIEFHQKVTLQRLMRLHSHTSHEAVFFLSGSLNAEALIHIQMFRLLDMIARLGPNNYLFAIGVFSIHNQITSSWFWRLQELAVKYDLPSPLNILLSPKSKFTFKKLVKTKVVYFWRNFYIQSMKVKSSLHFLRSEFLPFGSGPHSVWLSCEGSETAIHAATIQAKILTGKYRDDKLLSKFSEGLSGSCTLPGCNFYPGDCTHWLSFKCPALSSALSSTLNHSLEVLKPFPFLLEIVCSALSRSPKDWAQFIIDPSTDAAVIVHKQQFGDQSIWPLFKLSRAMIWCFHRERKRLNCL